MVKKDAKIQISTLIGKGCELNGDFKATGSARIDGCVNGPVEVEDAFILGAGAVINGDITCKSCMIGGEVNGDIISPEKCELTSSAKVLGNIVTNSIVIDENAILQGKVDMNQDVPDKKRKKVIKKNGSFRSAKDALAEALREVREDDEAENKEESVQESAPVSADAVENGEA